MLKIKKIIVDIGLITLLSASIIFRIDFNITINKSMIKNICKIDNNRNNYNINITNNNYYITKN